MSDDNRICRALRQGDREALVSLWTRVFGDPAELVEAFFDLLPEMGSGAVAEENGRVLGAAYLIDGFTLLSPDTAPKKCGYLYAVAVEEQFRGKGIGAQLSQAAASIGKARGTEVLCTLPAEPSLYKWYASVLSLYYVNHRTLYFSPATPPAKPLSAEEYGQRREELLTGTEHVCLSPAALAFQQKLCSCYGGGFYAAGDAIFCAYREDDGWRIAELLGTRSPEGWEGLRAEEVPYLCFDRQMAEGLVWNLSFE